MMVKWQIAETNRICKLHFFFYHLKTLTNYLLFPSSQSIRILGTAFGRSSRSRMCPDDQNDRQK